MSAPELPSVDPEQRLRALIILAGAAMFLDAVLFGALAPLLPGYVDELNLTKSEAGLLSGSIAAGLLLAAVPSASLANRIGGKQTVLVGLGILAAASAAFALAEAVEVMIVARFCQGLAGATIWGGGLTWVSLAAPTEGRGSAVGGLVGIGIAGTVAGPLVGSLAAATSPDLVFGAFPIIAITLALMLVRVPEGRERLQGGGLSSLLSQPAVRLATGANLWFLLLAAGTFGLVSVLGPLRLDELGVAAAAVGLIFLLAGGAEAVVNTVGGRATDRRGTIPLLRAGMLSLGSLIGAFGFAATEGGVAPVAVLVVAISAAMGLFGAPVNLSLFAVLRQSGIGEAHAFGIYNLGFSGGFLIGATGGSALADIAGDLAPCLLVGAAALITAQFVRWTRLPTDPSPSTAESAPGTPGPRDRGRR